MIDPSKLNEYPKGKTKLTMRLLHPNFSKASTSLGKADSEEAVENASKIGSLIAFNNLKNGILIK
jgi:hypothetical protein